MLNEKLKNFITLEGMDGCGKSTITEEVVKHLKNKGYEVLLTREPGGTELGEKIREIIKHDDMSLSTEILLLNAIRMEHLHKVIIPALNKGKIVVCDRYIDSTMVYQLRASEENRIKEEGIFNNLNDVRILREELEFKTLSLFRNFGIKFPETTLFLDVSVETSLSRRNARNEKIDKFEEKTYKDLENIRNAYHAIKNNEDKFKENRMVVIDANQTLEQVISSTLKVIDERYPNIKNAKKLKI